MDVPTPPDTSELLDLWAEAGSADLAAEGCCFGSASTIGTGSTFGSMGTSIGTGGSFGSGATIGTAC